MILRKLVSLACVAAMAASLGACATGSSTAFQNTVSGIEAQVQADANVICGFVPTAATIAAFIPGFGSAVAEAGTIAEGICSAVAQAPVVKPAAARMRAGLAASGADVTVATAKTPNGPVAVVGHFTR